MANVGDSLRRLYCLQHRIYNLLVIDPRALTRRPGVTDRRYRSVNEYTLDPRLRPAERQTVTRYMLTNMSGFLTTLE